MPIYLIEQFPLAFGTLFDLEICVPQNSHTYPHPSTNSPLIGTSIIIRVTKNS